MTKERITVSEFTYTRSGDDWRDSHGRPFRKYGSRWAMVGDTGPVKRTLAPTLTGSRKRAGEPDPCPLMEYIRERAASAPVALTSEPVRDFLAKEGLDPGPRSDGSYTAEELAAMKDARIALGLIDADKDRG